MKILRRKILPAPWLKHLNHLTFSHWVKPRPLKVGYLLTSVAQTTKMMTSAKLASPIVLTINIVGPCVLFVQPCVYQTNVSEISIVSGSRRRSPWPSTCSRRSRGTRRCNKWSKRSPPESRSSTTSDPTTARNPTSPDRISPTTNPTKASDQTEKSGATDDDFFTLT